MLTMRRSYFVFFFMFVPWAVNEQKKKPNTKSFMLKGNILNYKKQ